MQYTSDVRIVGRSFSNWWLLLILPVLALSLPFILLVSQAASGLIFGPPAIWNRPWHTPYRRDLVGKYSESERNWDGTSRYVKAQLELRADGGIVVNDLPWTSGEKTCMVTGTGRWEGPDKYRQINLSFVPAGERVGVCQQGAYYVLELAGHAKPYSLYWTLGDPDSGTGVWFTRN